MAPRTVAFLGPSIPSARARRLLPHASLRPPARQSDVLSAVRIDRPQVIALVDGTFAQTLSVWHKEILYALEQGVHVYGAASMGALRAAECHRFGMIGFGKIFEDFASGRLRDDDEVALSHAGADEGYRPLTEAMVNVRATLAAAREQSVIDTAEEGLLLGAAKRLYFAERTWGSLVALARGDGLDATRAEELQAWVRDHRVDQKRADAEALLAHIAALPDDLEPAKLREPLSRSHTFLALYERDRRVRRPAGEVSLDAIARYVMLHRGDADDLLAHALHRELTTAFAEHLRLEVSDEAVREEERRFRARRHLSEDAALAAWCTENDLDAVELEELWRSLAIARRLRDWLLARRFKRKAVQLLLDELRLRGEYAAAANAAAAREAALGPLDEAGAAGAEPQDITRRELIREHARATGWLPDTAIEQWAIESGFEDGFDVYLEMLRSRALRLLTSEADSAPST